MMFEKFSGWGEMERFRMITNPNLIIQTISGVIEWVGVFNIPYSEETLFILRGEDARNFINVDMLHEELELARQVSKKEVG